jgi:hypothetical protein
MNTETGNPRAMQSDRPMGRVRAPASKWLAALADVALAVVAVSAAAWLFWSRPVSNGPVAFAVSADDGGSASLTLRIGPDNRLAIGTESLDDAALVTRVRSGATPVDSAVVEVDGDSAFASAAHAVGLLRACGVRQVRISVAP